MRKAVTDSLLNRFPDRTLYQLHICRDKLVSNDYIAEMARERNLHLFIRTSNGHVNDAILANAAEALLGAISLDCGYDALRRVVEKEMTLCIATLNELVGGEGVPIEEQDDYYPVDEGVPIKEQNDYYLVDEGVSRLLLPHSCSREGCNPPDTRYAHVFLYIALEISGIVIFGTIAMLLITKPPFLHGITWTEPAPSVSVTQQFVSFFSSMFLP